MIQKSRLLILLAVGAVIGAFTYGFAAGVLQLFPFYQVKLLRDRLAESRAVARAVPVAEGPFAAVLLETELERVITKRIQLPNSGDSFTAGGAISSLGNDVFVLDRDGALHVYDFATPRRLDVNVPRVPINRADVLATTVRYRIPIGWFRVAGTLAVPASDGGVTLWAYHNRFDDDRRCFTANVSRIKLRRQDASIAADGNWQTVLETSPCMRLQPAAGYGRHAWAGHISGGKLVALGGDSILVSVGDYNFDGYLRPAWSMDTTNLYGKYVLIDAASGRASIFATGARNNMGLFRDGDGTLWSTESGPQGGDELNRVHLGANFGWPTVSYGLNYETTPWPSNPTQGRHDGYEEPVFAWIPSIVPTNIARLDSSSGRFKVWHGDLVLGSLRDESIHRLRLSRSGSVVYNERIPVGERIRDLARLADGRLVYLTDNSGYLVIWEDGGPSYEPLDDRVRRRMAELDGLDALQDTSTQRRVGAASGQRVFEARCSSCHKLIPENGTGPHLSGLFSRRVGGAQGFRYSYDLSVSQARWSDELLASYFANPKLVFASTRMQRQTLSRPEVDSLISYLRREVP